jgi:acetyl esterase/lipase
MMPALCLTLALSLALALVATTAAADPEPAVQTNVSYGSAGGQDLLLDIYRPAAAGPHPGVAFIHGGGWAGGDKSGWHDGALNLARAGFVCFSIDYRLAPKFTYPCQCQDVFRAVRWIRAHAQNYDLDPARLGAMGDSAGGHLSLMLGVMPPDAYQVAGDPNRDQPSSVQCVVDIYGPSDMTPTLMPEAAPIILGFLGVPFDKAPNTWMDASPISHVTKDAAPTIFLHGDADTLVPLEQSKLMQAALDKVGVPTELVVVHNGGHGFPGATQDDIAHAYQRAVAWLQRFLTPPPGPR